MRMLPPPNGKIVSVNGEVLAFELPRLYSHAITMTHIDDPTCPVIYELREKDDGAPFDLIIEDAIVGSRLLKEIQGAQRFIATNLKQVAETGSPVFSGRMVKWLAPVFSL